MTAFLCSLLCYAANTYALCSISTTPLNFGNYNVLSPNPLDVSNTIIVNCNQNAVVTLSIGPSPNSGGFNPRKMKRTTATEYIDYNIFRNSARTEILGDGTGSTYTLIRNVRKNRPAPYSIHGRIPPAQDVSIGTYNETLTVTIVW